MYQRGKRWNIPQKLRNKQSKAPITCFLDFEPHTSVSHHLISSWMLKVQLSGFESTDKLQAGGGGGGGKRISRLLLSPHMS